MVRGSRGWVHEGSMLAARTKHKRKLRFTESACVAGVLLANRKYVFRNGDLWVGAGDVWHPSEKTLGKTMRATASCSDIIVSWSFARM